MSDEASGWEPMDLQGVIEHLERETPEEREQRREREGFYTR